MQLQQRRLFIGILITIAAFVIAYLVMRPVDITGWALFKALALILILAFTELARLRFQKRNDQH